jgi:hypothetical protein
MVFWRCCVTGEESVGDESSVLREGNLVSRALDLNFGR